MDLIIEISGHNSHRVYGFVVDDTQNPKGTFRNGIKDMHQAFIFHITLDTRRMRQCLLNPTIMNLASEAASPGSPGVPG